MSFDKIGKSDPQLPEKPNSPHSSSSIFRGRKVSKPDKTDVPKKLNLIVTPPDSTSESEPPQHPDTPHPSSGAHTVTTLGGTTTTFQTGPGENLLQNPHDLDALVEVYEEITDPADEEFPESLIDKDSTPSATSSIPSSATISSSTSSSKTSSPHSSYKKVRDLEGKRKEFEGESKHLLTTHFSPFQKKSPRGGLPGSFHLSESQGVVGSCDFSQGKFTIHTKHTANFTLVFDRPSIHLPRAGGQVKDSETPMPIFHKWLNDSDEATKRSQQIERVHYADDAIAPAIEKFEKQFNCNWSLLKHAFKKGDVKPEEMQIIQDLRTAYNCYIIKDLTQYFSDPQYFGDQGFVFQAVDCGNPTLGSDADFGLDIHAKEESLDEITLQAKQAEAVIQFNSHYERIWKHPSAIIFDTNAYSKQYVRQIHHDDLDQANSAYQANASIMMRMKLVHGTWGSYVDEVNRKFSKNAEDITAIQKKQSQFTNISDRYTQLENAKLLKMIEVSVVPQHATHTEIVRWQTFIQELWDTIDTPSTQKTVKNLIAVIKNHNPDIEIWASNLLHEDSERRCTMLEKTRYKLLNFLKEMNEGAAQGKGKKFNELLEDLTHDFMEHQTGGEDDEVRVAYSNYLQDIRYKKFNDESLTKDLDGMLEQCFKQAAELQGQKVKIQKVLKSLAAIITLKEKTQLLEKHGDETADQRKEIKSSIEKLQDQLLQDLSKTPIKIKGGNYERAYQNAIEELKNINSQINKLYSSPMGGRVKLIHGMVDNILIDVQKSTAIGQYFAQEALMSIGGYAYVVINLQQKSPEVRSISQYCQAFNEVAAYYENHQRHQEKPFDKLVEASKYGERCILALEDLRLKTHLLKIAGPDFTADLATIPGHSLEEKLYKLEKFFNQVLLIRKGMIGDKVMDQAEKQHRLRNAALLLGIRLGDKEEFSEKNLLVINTTMRALATTLEAWRSWIPLDVQSF